MNTNIVFEKTRELAEALIQSDAYQKMKAAEDDAMKSPEAAETMTKYMEVRGELEKIIATEDFDSNEMKRLSTEMDDLQTRLQMMDPVVRMTEARNEFSALMTQVNQVLSFIITGQMDEGSCTGSCASCSAGCASAKN